MQTLSKQYCLPAICLPGDNSAVWLGLQGQHCARGGEPSDVNMGSFTEPSGKKEKKINLIVCDGPALK